MKIMTLPLLLAAALSVGCQSSAQERELELTLLQRSDHCRVTHPSFRPLRNREEALRLTAPRTLIQAPESLPEVDFSTHTVMLLAMGEQPSSGYSIKLDPERSRADEGTLWLSVRFDPPQREVQATLVTSPCVILSLKRGELRKIVAGDTGLVYRF